MAMAMKGSDFEDQMEVFETQLRLARKREDPYGEFCDEFENMMKTLRKYEDTKNRLVSKNKSLETSIASKKEKSNAASGSIEEVLKKQEKLRNEITRFNDERQKVQEQVTNRTTASCHCWHSPMCGVALESCTI